MAAEEFSDFDVRLAYRDHGAALFGFAFNGTGDRGVAEDCVQETFIRAWKARSRFREDKGSQRTWLFAIARNVVIDAHRARSRRPVLVDDERREEPSPTVEQQEQAVERLVLLEGLARLRPEHREVIVAVQVEGLSYQQLAERTGVAVGTLRSRMFYGLKALKTELGEEEAHDRRHVAS